MTSSFSVWNTFKINDKTLKYLEEIAQIENKFDKDRERINQLCHRLGIRFINAFDFEYLEQSVKETSSLWNQIAEQLSKNKEDQSIQEIANKIQELEPIEQCKEGLVLLEKLKDKKIQHLTLDLSKIESAFLHPSIEKLLQKIEKLSIIFSKSQNGEPPEKINENNIKMLLFIPSDIIYRIDLSNTDCSVFEKLNFKRPLFKMDHLILMLLKHSKYRSPLSELILENIGIKDTSNLKALVMKEIDDTSKSEEQEMSNLSSHTFKNYRGGSR